MQVTYAWVYTICENHLRCSERENFVQNTLAMTTEHRARVVEALGDAMDDRTPLRDVATELEETILSLHGSATDQYKAQARRLAEALKQNKSLSRRLRSGEIGADAVARMSPTELAEEDEQARSQREQMRATAMRRRTAQKEGIPTQEYACPNCGKREAVYQRQGSIDATKQEIWGGVSAEQERILLACIPCGAEWSAAS